MSDNTLLSIGQFARLAGLSVHALRHYDAVGLLAPAHVDPETGYRRYTRNQLAAARLISDLRWLDLPLHLVRDIIADPDSPEARQVLAAHADRLVRDRMHLDRQIAQSSRYTSQGVPMPTTVTGTAPVQIKLAVADVDRARAFYAAAFGLSESVIRHTDDADFTAYQFGTYGQPGFFLLTLSEPEEFDHPGRGTIGFTVEDLDQAHGRALGAGATEAVPISSPQGMPRNSAVTDPDGNWLWLYQG
jgi:DNA-binding transcriptional MerR regulator